MLTALSQAAVYFIISSTKPERDKHFIKLPEKSMYNYLIVQGAWTGFADTRFTHTRGTPCHRGRVGVGGSSSGSNCSLYYDSASTSWYSYVWNISLRHDLQINTSLIREIGNQEKSTYEKIKLRVSNN